MVATSFQTGQLFTRAQVAAHIGLPLDRRKGGHWDTGYSRWNDEFFIFCNVGVAGTTGHDYPNRWAGKDLIWSGKTNSRKDQPFVRAMLSGARPVHLFWRGELRTPFTYAGLCTAAEVADTIPVRVRWSFETVVPTTQELAPSAPLWHRGPPPTTGTQTIVKEDGPTELYLMALVGFSEAILLKVAEGFTPIKVGISNNPVRRAEQLNEGFPPGALVTWQVRQTRTYPSANDAFIAEGRVLEALRVSKRWIGGEFAVVPTDELGQILALDSET
ncbi:MAG TPA: hypothetical protein VGW40_11400 [Allosphingosinicella sp.]|nr:hypothetical protein [Allosphingosinicella sp.]